MARHARPAASPTPPRQPVHHDANVHGIGPDEPTGPNPDYVPEPAAPGLDGSGEPFLGAITELDTPSEQASQPASPAQDAPAGEPGLGTAPTATDAAQDAPANAGTSPADAKDVEPSAAAEPGALYRCTASGDFTMRLPNSRHLGRKVASGAVVLLTDDEYLANTSAFEPYVLPLPTE